MKGGVFLFTKETIAELAELSQLSLDENETAQAATSLNRLWADFLKLQEWCTHEITATTYGTETTNVLRPDTPTTSMSKADALQNGPDSSKGYFRVPQIIED